MLIFSAVLGWVHIKSKQVFLHNYLSFVDVSLQLPHTRLHVPTSPLLLCPAPPILCRPGNSHPDGSQNSNLHGRRVDGIRMTWPYQDRYFLHRIATRESCPVCLYCLQNSFVNRLSKISIINDCTAKVD